MDFDFDSKSNFAFEGEGEGEGGVSASAEQPLVEAELVRPSLSELLSDLENDPSSELMNELDALPLIELNPPTDTSQVPAQKDEKDAQIDARLQEELDSLPMVEPEPEAEPDPKLQQQQQQLQQLLLQQHQQHQRAMHNQPAGRILYKPRSMGDSVKFPLQKSMDGTAVQKFTSPNYAMQQLKMAQAQAKLQLGANPYKMVVNSQVNDRYRNPGMPRHMYLTHPGQPQVPTGFPKTLTDFINSKSNAPGGVSQSHHIRNVAQSHMAKPTLNAMKNDLGSNQVRPSQVRREAPPMQPSLVEDDEVDFEEIGVADTYSSYWPSKLKGGSRHPDPVVETATLSSVELPDITYELALPDKVKNSDRISALQLEAVIYACQAHEQYLPCGQRAGFLLGDGAGVGKGRTIAAIIYENYLRGRKRALWISVSNDLKFDAERDLLDIGASKHLKVASMSKFKYSRISSEENEYFKKGVIFCTYTALIGESANANPKYNTRLRQLINWLGSDFDGVIVLDECHKAKNLSLMNAGKSTKTGTTVLELQQLLPMARVVYASATGASEPRNMAYMVRLGLWGQGTSYSEFFKFVNTVEKRGIGAMEIVAMDMKLRGSYIARQLSFKEVSFRIEEVPMSRDFHKLYNHSAELWAEINEKFIKACRLMCIENRVQKIITCQFWSAHQRFFKNLCIASKVSHVVKMVREAARQGKAVVIGLQSTGESRTLEHLELYQGELSNFVSTSKMIVQSFVEKYFPAPTRESLYKLLNTGTFEPEARSKPPNSKRARLISDWSDDEMDVDGGESDIELCDNWNDGEDDEERIKSGRKRRGRPPKPDKGMNKHSLIHSTPSLIISFSPQKRSPCRSASFNIFTTT